MTKSRRLVSTLLATTLAAGAGWIAAAPALAAAPPWQSPATDPHNVGTLAFYDASGNQITTGSDLTSLGKYAKATGLTPLPGNAKAIIFAYTPNAGLPPGAWSGNALTGATSFPNATAPAPLNTDPNPVVTEDPAQDTTLDDFSNNSYPNNSTTAGYQNVYELRLRDSGPSGVDVNYAVADVTIDQAAHTWTQVFPAVTQAPPTSTTTTISGSASGSVAGGTMETLTATVSPSAAAGSVQFFEGTTAVGSPVAVSGGTAVSPAFTPAAGAHTYTATFTPTDAVSYTTSSSSTGVTVTEAAPVSTSVTLSPSAAGPVTVGTVETLTATETPAVAGSVVFFDGATALGGAVAVNGSGVATTSTTPAVGSHSYTATFTPTNTGAHTASTSAASTVVVSKATGTVTVTLTPTASTYGTTTSVAVSITAPSLAPLGTVSLSSPGGPLGTATLSGGKATFTIPATALKPGAVVLTVAYSGDANVSAGAATATLAVTSAPSTIKIKLTKTKIKVTAKGKISVTIVAAGFTPTGKIQIFDGKRKKAIASGVLKNGKVTITLPKLKKGTHTLSVKYLGSDVSLVTSKSVKLKVIK
jgi:hypothetical protein